MQCKIQYLPSLKTAYVSNQFRSAFYNHVSKFKLKIYSRITLTYIFFAYEIFSLKSRGQRFFTHQPFSFSCQILLLQAWYATCNRMHNQSRSETVHITIEACRPQDRDRLWAVPCRAQVSLDLLLLQRAHCCSSRVPISTGCCICSLVFKFNIHAISTKRNI